MRLRNYVVLMSLLCAAPLAGQGTSTTTLVAPIENIVNVLPTPFVINLPVDSAHVARDLAIIAELRVISQALAEDRDVPTSRVVRVGQGALVAAVLWGVWEFRQWRKKEGVPDVHNEGDTNVTVTHPPTPPHDGSHDDGDSESD